MIALIPQTMVAAGPVPATAQPDGTPITVAEGVAFGELVELPAQMTPSDTVPAPPPAIVTGDLVVPTPPDPAWVLSPSMDFLGPLAPIPPTLATSDLAAADVETVQAAETAPPPPVDQASPAPSILAAVLPDTPRPPVSLPTASVTTPSNPPPATIPAHPPQTQPSPQTAAAPPDSAAADLTALPTSRSSGHPSHRMQPQDGKTPPSRDGRVILPNGTTPPPPPTIQTAASPPKAVAPPSRPATPTGSAAPTSQTVPHPPAVAVSPATPLPDGPTWHDQTPTPSREAGHQRQIPMPPDLPRDTRPHHPLAAPPATPAAAPLPAPLQTDLRPQDTPRKPDGTLRARVRFPAGDVSPRPAPSTTMTDNPPKPQGALTTPPRRTIPEPMPATPTVSPPGASVIHPPPAALTATSPAVQDVRVPPARPATDLHLTAPWVIHQTADRPTLQPEPTVPRAPMVTITPNSPPDPGAPPAHSGLPPLPLFQKPLLTAWDRASAAQAATPLDRPTPPQPAAQQPVPAPAGWAGSPPFWPQLLPALPERTANPSAEGNTARPESQPDPRPADAAPPQPLLADRPPPDPIPLPLNPTAAPDHRPTLGSIPPGGVAPPDPAPPAPQHAPHSLPPKVAGTLTDAVKRIAKDDPIELLLDPVELGKVRFEMTTTGDRVQVNLSVERPETLDLLRRNMDSLRSELSAAGFDASTLSFGDWGHRRDDATPDTAPPMTFGDDPADLPTATPTNRSPQDQGLDLRL